MPTKTKTKKRVVLTKKTAKKKVSTVVQVLAEPAEADDIFTSDEQPEKVAVKAGSVLLFIGDDNHGVVECRGLTLSQFVREHAEEAGLMKFSVYVDGLKASRGMGDEPMTKFRKVDLIAKDSRG